MRRAESTGKNIEQLAKHRRRTVLRVASTTTAAGFACGLKAPVLRFDPRFLTGAVVDAEPDDAAEDESLLPAASSSCSDAASLATGVLAGAFAATAFGVGVVAAVVAAGLVAVAAGLAAGVVVVVAAPGAGLPVEIAICFGSRVPQLLQKS